MIETWYAMTARHKRERRDMVEDMADKLITQTQAARQLETSLTCLNNYITRNRIYWPVVKRGRSKRKNA